MNKYFITLLFATTFFCLRAQSVVKTFNQQLTWQPKELSYQGQIIKTFTFNGASWDIKTPTLPHLYLNFPVNSYGDLKVTLRNPIYETLDRKAAKDDGFLSNDIAFSSRVNIARKEFIAFIDFVPIRKTAFGYEKLVQFELDVQLINKAIPTVDAARGGPTTSSVLKDGSIVKYAIEGTGIQRIDGKSLKAAGIDIANINPKKIKVYGNAGGMLPEKNADFRYDDLTENPCVVVGEDDGKFAENDYILFYAIAADKWYFDAKTGLFEMAKNVYSTNSFYFVKVDGEDGKRITTQSSVSQNPDFVSTGFNDFQRYEQDKYNLLNEYESTPGGGRQWFGEKFTTNKKTFSLPDFSFPNIETNSKVNVKAALAYRSTASGAYTLNVGNESFYTNVGSCGSCDEESNFATIGTVNEDFTASSDVIPTSVAISSSNNDMQSYLDFVQINARRKLSANGYQLAFRDVNSLNKKVVKYEIEKADAYTLWDVSDPVAPQKIDAANNNGTLSFSSLVTSADKPKEFVAFNSSSNLLVPTAIGKVENQNLHGISDDVEMVILTSKALEKEANRLATYRKSKNGLKVVTVLLDQLNNEFACGALDPVAIRDFARFLYEKNKNFKYLLLFGDGSFNYKGIGVGAEEIAKNHIPPYETEESLDPIYSFPSDDYYGLLSPNEGDLLDNGALDISVGRITASDEDMAKTIVDKIINYDSNPEAMRDYRNRLFFVADDFEADSSPNWETVFLEHSEKMSVYTESVNKNINIEKAYLAAFSQITTPAGQRSPDATESINNNIFKGTLLLNYTGHGGPRGWTQERVLNASVDVPNWSNFDRLPLFMTATCSFGAYDSPNDFTAGEQILALDKGGAVGLYSTVRAVYQDANESLVEAVFSQVFKKDGYNGKTFGEILRLSKNAANGAVYNSRKFALLGDPSQRLMLPQYSIKTTKINGKNITNTSIDTLGALQKLTVEGVVTDSAGNVLSNFNGKVYPTIYDKALTLKTVPIGTFTQNYRLQNKVLFKGAATVKNGKFEFQCIIPKDINYDYGFGKISYYATNDVNDAAGYDVSHIVIGGVSKSAIKDDKGPLVEVFMDNEDFVNGGTVSPNPTLLIKLSDDFGINVSGNSIGHDLTATLDNDSKLTYRLNDFYQSQTDNPTKGKAEYPLLKLSEGLHHVSVKGWDTSNNPGEGSTDFVVAASGKSALEHVLNYPNPFTTSTEFQFRHHLSEINLNVQVQIFSVSGKLVKTIETDAVSRGGVVTGIEWDGKDDYGSDIGKGVYVYKVRVRSIRNTNLKEEGAFEKLVILR